MTERKHMKPDDLVDQAIHAVRDDGLADDAVELAASRVWDRVSRAAAALAQADPGRAIQSCADVQALLPSFAAGELAEARALLVEDHARSCAACRKALERARHPAAERPQIALVGAPGRFAQLWQRLPVRALAAAIFVALGLAGIQLAGGHLGPAPVLAQPEIIDGTLYRVTDQGNEVLSPGEAIRARESIRSARDANVVLRLADGSRVEVADRSELALSRRGGDTTIRLERGSVIVQAAEQGAGHLYVVTKDCRVAVTGTVFTVRRGTKGSRVSVIQGQVQVTQGGAETTLEPGGQISTDPRLGAMPINEEIAWSRDLDEYLALLTELRQLRDDLKQIPQPDLRYESRLLAGVPDDTVIYVAAPNVSATLGEMNRLLEARMAESEVLSQWWASKAPAGADGPTVSEVVDRIEIFGDYLGDELVIAAGMGATGEPGMPIVLAELAKPEAFRVAVESEIDRLLAEYGDGSGVGDGVGVDDGAGIDDGAGVEDGVGAGDGVAVDDGVGADAGDDTGATAGVADGNRPVIFMNDAALAAATAAGESDPEALLVWTGDGFMAAGADATRLQAVVAHLGQAADGGSGFGATPFGEQIRGAYADGLSWLMAVDLGAIVDDAVAAEASQDESRIIDQMGLQDAKYLIIAQRSAGEDTESRAALTFNGPRRGIAAWLSEPAPMGALSYIGADAYAASAFVVRDPAALVADMAEIIKASDPSLDWDAVEPEADEDLSLLADLAGALGGEMALALDGPVLPKPSWKLVVEVYDAARLQRALEALVARVNADLARAGEGPLVLERSQLAGRDSYTLRKSDGEGDVLHYVIADGYLIVAPARALLERAIQAAEVGNNLASAESFTSHLPHDGRTDMSAIFYQNLAPVLGPLANYVAQSGQSMTAEQRAAIESLGLDMSPSLVYAYAEPDRIIVASTTEFDPLGLGLGNLFGIGGLAGLGGLLSVQ